MQDNPFAQYAQPQATPAPQGPINSGVDPRIAEREAAAARTAERNAIGDSRDARDFGTKRADTSFSQTSSLRNEFRKLPTFQSYDVALGAFNSSLKTAANAQGDQSLITSYAKMLDPTSAVREGEFATTASTENTVNQIKAKLAKEFGFEEGGMLSPEGRTFVRQEMWNLVNERFRPAYERDRQDYTALAEDYGFEAQRVVGTDPTARYQEAIDEFLNQGAEQAPAEAAPTEPESGGLTIGDPTEREGFGDDGNGNPLVIDTEQGLQFLMRQEGGEGVQYGIADGFDGDLSDVADPRALRLLQTIENRQKDGDAGAIDLAKNGITLGLLDESSGVGTAIGRALTGDFELAENYKAGREAERLRLERARNETGLVGTAAEVIGGGAGILGKAGTVMRAGRAAKVPNQPLTAPAVRQQMAKQAAKDGTVIGGTAGFGYGEGLEGSTSSAAIGAASGGALGGLAQKLGNALASRPQAAAAPQANALATAGQNQGVTVNRAMVNPNSGNAVARVDATSAGGPRLQEGVRKVEGEIEAGVRGLGGNRASPEPEALGATLSRATTRATDSARTRASNLYDKADEMVAGETVVPQKAIDAIDNNIAELEASGANANRGEIKFLQDIKEDIASGISIKGLRDQRTNLRGQITERTLGATSAERRISDVLDAASDDIAGALQQSGNQRALNLYNRADGIWRERAQFKKDISKELLGAGNRDKSGAEIVKKLNSWVRDDPARFEKLYKTLDEDEAAEIAASVANGMGTNAKGEFSPTLFLNHMPGGQSEKISPRALKTVFGEDGAKAAKELRLLSQEIHRVSSSMNSRKSSTAVAQNGGFQGWLWNGMGLLGGSGVGLASGSATAGLATAGVAGAAFGAKLGRDVLSSKMLLSPKIAKWIRTAPRSANPQAIDRHFGKLGDIAKAQPALSSEIEALRSAITRAANDNPAGALAAEDQGAQ